MGKTFVRIDDRLIHGQIVAAWSTTLGIKQIIAVDSSLAENPMLQSIMTMGVPARLNPKILNVGDAKRLLAEDVDYNRLVITRFCEVLSELREEITGAEHINLGNCSKRDGAVYRIPSGAGRYLYFTQADFDALKKEEADGVKIFTQLLPTDKLRTWDWLKNNMAKV